MYRNTYRGKHVPHPSAHFPVPYDDVRPIPIRSETRVAHEPSKSLHTMGVQPSLDV